MTCPVPIIWHPAYEIDIGPHVFPTQKYRLIVDRLASEGLLSEADILRPDSASDQQVALVHTPDYLHKIESGTLSRLEQMALEVPFSAELREGMWLCAGGSILAAERALAVGTAVHLGGGYHHAFPDHGEGFCLINDVAIAIRTLQQAKSIERAVVIDCDVHHGNGTAAIFADDPAVFTFSIHQERNYPAWKPPSDLDLGLADGTGDDEYLSLLSAHIPVILDQHRPQLAFYLAGADPYRQDQLGGLGLTIDGLKQRDGLVHQLLCERSVPVAAVLAGGYAARTNDTIEIHCNTVRQASQLAQG
jgi:acetoin utilization deacetylase AcuC-like enzyme